MKSHTGSFGQKATPKFTVSKDDGLTRKVSNSSLIKYTTSGVLEDELVDDIQVGSMPGLPKIEEFKHTKKKRAPPRNRQSSKLIIMDKISPFKHRGTNDANQDGGMDGLNKSSSMFLDIIAKKGGSAFLDNPLQGLEGINAMNNVCEIGSS